MNPRIKIISTISHFEGTKLDEEGLSAVARLDFQQGIAAIAWLLERRYIYRHKGEYHVTTLGKEYIEQIGCADKKNQSIRKWKEEALSGLKEVKSKKSNLTVTAPSELDRCVLSTTPRWAPERLLPDAALIEFEKILALRKSLCKDLNITLADYDKLNKEGRLRVCKRGSNHIGIFDRKGQNRWHHICKACRSKIRKAQRDAKRRPEKNSRDAKGVDGTAGSS